MAEAVFGFLYQVAVYIVGIITRVFVWLFGSYVERKLENVLEEHLDPKKKLEKPIGKLRTEKWFRDMEDDYRYGYIIWNNGAVEKYLLDEENIPMLLKLPEEQMKFTQLVMHEHRKFVGR